MTQVIDILEPLVAQEMSHEETIPQCGSGSITLYEVPKDQPENPNGGLGNQLKIESTREDEPCPKPTS